jgi:hypothetical protein
VTNRHNSTPSPQQRLAALLSRWHGLLDRWAADGSLFAAASDALQLQAQRRTTAPARLASWLQSDVSSLPAVCLLSAQQMGSPRRSLQLGDQRDHRSRHRLSSPRPIR